MARTMVDMARDASEIKKDIAQSSPVEAKAPVYPYGLCLSFDEDVLEKLGMENDLPEIGDMLHIMAMTKVTSVSQYEREGTDGNREKCCRVELQVTHIGVEDEDREEDRAARRYGKKDEEDSE